MQDDELLTAVHTPELTGASCRNHLDTFDAAERSPVAQAQARRICAGCPALAACAAWLASLPAASRPFGVTAGHLITKRALAHPNQARKRST
jgi:WhiB family redox-sensing transcriptional regulator